LFLDFKNEDMNKLSLKMKDEIQILKKIDDLRQISVLMENNNKKYINNNNSDKKYEQEQIQEQNNVIIEFESLPDDFKLDQDDDDLNKSLSNFQDELTKMKNIRIKSKPNTNTKIKKDSIKKEKAEFSTQTDINNEIPDDQLENINNKVIECIPITKKGKVACWLCYKITNKEDAITDSLSNKQFCKQACYQKYKESENKVIIINNLFRYIALIVKMKLVS